MQKRVRQWVVSKSIPGEYWPLLERLGIATMAELGADAASRKGITLPASSTAVSEQVQ